MNIQGIRTAPRSPWQNAYVERVIGSIRRECLDHVIVAIEAWLQRVVDVMTPLGMLQPRELRWDFMGFSRSYQLFTGAVELLGVVFLFFGRTTLLGALILIGALTNVLMMDIAYGVSVRRIALRLLLPALVLAAADLSRLINLLVR